MYFSSIVVASAPNYDFLEFSTKFDTGPDSEHLTLYHAIATLNTLKKKAFENILEKEKMLVTSIFSFFHNVFLLFPAKISISESELA